MAGAKCVLTWSKGGVNKKKYFEGLGKAWEFIKKECEGCKLERLIRQKGKHWVAPTKWLRCGRDKILFSNVDAVETEEIVEFEKLAGEYKKEKLSETRPIKQKREKIGRVYKTNVKHDDLGSSLGILADNISKELGLKKGFGRGYYAFSEGGNYIGMLRGYRGKLRLELSLIHI